MSQSAIFQAIFSTDRIVSKGTKKQSHSGTHETALRCNELGMVGIVQNKSGLICVQQLLSNFAAALLSFYRFALWAHRITLTLFMLSHGRSVFA